MKNNGANRSPVLKALGLVGVLGTAGAIVLAGSIAGSGCNESNNASGVGGHGGIAGTGGHGGVTGAGGGGGAATDAGVDGAVSPTATNVLIQNFMYMPATFTVAAGASVTVHNTDTMNHSMTSESATGNFTLGAVNGVQFDTGPIPPGGNASFTIPANTPSGTMIPFFCTVHTRGMQEGMITVQ